MKIAVEGCAHGDLDKIYETIEQLEKLNSIKIDLLIICGDFQAVRNYADMQCLAVPPKYRQLNTFYKYYSGVKKAPMLTIFVGGNHEASNYSSELPYGGWVCPNIYYMGYASVINIGGLRIAGLSGIYKGKDYLRGHFEYPPYDENSKRSVYHVRNIEIFRLKQIKKPIDIFISHDWPTGVYNYGNVKALLNKKGYFKEEVANNSLGSQPAEELLNKLKPSYWFAAHLHCKFAAVVPHEENGHKSFTKFLALDKCLPRRKFLQVIDIESTSDVSNIEYDVEWLSILHHTNHLLSVSKRNCFMPGKGCSERWDFTPTEKEMETVKDLFNGDLKIPNNFAVTAPIHDPTSQRNSEKLKVYSNPQTEKFCETLNVTDPLSLVLKDLGVNKSTHDVSFDPNEIDLSDDNSADEPETSNTDLDVSGCNDFFIDKTGSHSDSKQESGTSFEIFTFPEINESSSKTNTENFSFPEIKESNVETEKTENEIIVENPLKKFKRRNQALYQSDDCDL